MFTKNEKSVEVPEVKMEVKMEVKPASGLVPPAPEASAEEVKRKRWTIPQEPKTIGHEQSELTPTSANSFNSFNSPASKASVNSFNSFSFTTEPCVDLKTILRSDRRAKKFKDYRGVLTRDSRDHFTFIETQPTTAKRNPQLFRGKYITITRWADGSLHPNFRPMPANTSVEHYAFNVYRELLGALKGLVEKE